MKYIRMKIKFLDVSKMLQITVMHYRTFLVPIKLYKYIAWLKEGVHTNKNSSPGKKKTQNTQNFKITKNMNSVFGCSTNKWISLKNKRFPPIWSIYISIQNSVVCLR